MAAAPSPQWPVNLALREHEHTPLYDIQRWAGLGAGGLFDSLLVFENYPMAEALGQAAGSALEFSAISRQEQTNYPLTLVAVTGAELSLGLSYDRACFDAPTVARLGRELEHLLRAFMAAPQQALGNLELLAGEPRQAALDWGKGTVTPLDSGDVLTRIDAQVLAQPQAPAILFAEREVDYASLDRSANRLAHKLRELGVGPEVRVGVCLSRIGLLAILKAGGAYVPLDPEYPQERLLHMLEDSRATVLLSESRLLQYLPPELSSRVLLVEEGEDWLQAYPAQAPAVSIQPQNLAYVIYTSGSTGKPKGVVVSHGEIAMHCEAVIRRFDMRADDCELHFYSINFDAATERLLVPLLSGARVVLRAQGQWDAEEICQLIRQQQVKNPSVPGASRCFARSPCR